MCGHCTRNPLVQRKTKCQQCLDATLISSQQRKKRILEEGLNCVLCNQTLSESNTCDNCGTRLMNVKLKGLQDFVEYVEGKDDGIIQCNHCGEMLDHVSESVCFTLHHRDYLNKKTSRTFDSVCKFSKALKDNSPQHYIDEERLELLCRPCHALEHSQKKKMNSNWAKLHQQVVELKGGKCESCGVTLSELRGNHTLFEIHHVNRDGTRQRELATEDIAHDERVIAQSVNECKAILSMKGSEKKEKLATLECLCEGCHYFQHMDRNIKGVLEGCPQQMEQVKRKLSRFFEIMDGMSEEDE